MSDPEYPAVDLNITDDTPGDRAALAVMADMSMRDARAARENPEAREPVESTAGYHVTWETESGVVGLWNCWLKDAFYLGYPTDWGTIDPDLIVASFSDAQPHSRYRPEYGRNVGNWTVPLPEHSQTVSLAVDDHNCYCQHFHIIRGTELHQYGPPQAMYGWSPSTFHQSAMSDLLTPDSGRRVFSEPFWRPEGIEPGEWNDRNPEWDAARAEFFDVLAPAFVRLGCALANAHKPTGVTVELGMGPAIVPEHLDVMGFDVQWLKGEPGKREGWGADAVYGRRGDEEVMLVSANSLVPWKCFRRKPVNGEVTSEFVRELLTF